MPAPKRERNGQLAMLKRRKKAGELYLQGKTQWEIAQILKTTQKTISKDLAAVDKEWRDKMLVDANMRNCRALEELELVKSQAWKSWLLSKQPTAKSKAQRPGDERFLARVFACVEAKLKILGLIKPSSTRVSVTQAIGVPWDELAATVPQGELPDVIEERMETLLLEYEEESLKGKIEQLQGKLSNGNGKHTEPDA